MDCSRAIRLSWKFGLELWTIRNQLIHGTVNGISRVEIERVQTQIKSLYRELPHRINQRPVEVFDISEADLLQTGYHNQVAWIGKTQFLYPQETREIEQRETIS